MDMGGGHYMIAARASQARGASAGAMEVAYKDAQTFCGGRGAHAIVDDTGDRDVPGFVAGGSWGPNGGGFGGGTYTAGAANLRFHCEK
jgi:hypothetical protein